jgi:pyruvate kinase
LSASIPKDSGRPDFPTRAELLELIHSLMRIKDGMVALEASVDLARFGSRSSSARNLLHYIALRQQDIRSLQEELSAMGISSLGRSESNVLYNIDAVIRILQGLAHEAMAPQSVSGGVTSVEGREVLEAMTERLFGRRENGREVRMMVTMPSDAATDYTLVRDLVAAGMDCMRINCAHDDEPAWLSMIENLRKSEKEVGRRCKVLMDIAGPKIRTGTLELGPQVLRLKPEKDSFGRVVKPELVILAANEARTGLPNDSTPVLRVPQGWLGKLEEGSEVAIVDARGAKRKMIVSIHRRKVIKGELWKTVYLDPSTKLNLRKGGRTYSTTVLNVPHKVNPIILRKGDTLVITASQEDGRPASQGEPAVIPCTLPEAIPFVKAGERIWLDDGKIGGVVRSASPEELIVEVIHASEDGTKLGADKGINLPDTNLRLPPLTPKDLDDLRFIVDHADMVGYSFVRASEDLKTLRLELARLGKTGMGIILKIETKRAFEQLPSLLLESMKGPVSGVMVARGDLAVECGYERLAEVQEEILWMSEAAHMPTIWATQVLEGLTKGGIPSRAEVTDAAVGGRSECVMLNKGPHVVDALKALDSILRRMQSHQFKKKSMMRQLTIAESFFKTVSAR